MEVQENCELIKAINKLPQGQQKMILTEKDDSVLASLLSFQISEAKAEKGKPFSDGKFTKHCLTLLAKLACIEKKHLIEQTSLPSSLSLIE